MQTEYPHQKNIGKKAKGQTSLRLKVLFILRLIMKSCLLISICKALSLYIKIKAESEVNGMSLL